MDSYSHTREKKSHNESKSQIIGGGNDNDGIEDGDGADNGNGYDTSVYNSVPMKK